MRAFDLKIGTLVWNLDAANPDAAGAIADGETYTENAPNSWSVASYDPVLGLVYLPFGVTAPDQYGIVRSEAVEKFCNTVTALDVATIDGRKVAALVQPTKQGDIFVLDRTTGEPVHPIREILASQNSIPDEPVSATQRSRRATAGGLAFLSGTVDYYVRGYNLANGRAVWKARLPPGGQSTQATYLGRDGRQYLVVVAGGHRYTETKTGDSVIAYALPEE